MRSSAAAALLLALAGCLAPQDIELEPPAAPTGNRAPRILPDTALVDGFQRSKVAVGQDCEPVFTIGAIEDFDQEDDLEVRWFVNYDDGEHGAVQSRILQGGADVREGIRRDGGDTFRLLDLDVGRGGVIVVEAVVSDGFELDPTLEPANRRVLPGKDFDSYTWTLIVTPDGICP